MESEDPAFYKSLEFLLEHPIEELGTELNFSLEVEEFGVRSMRQLKPDGAQTVVTDENKEEYVKLVCQMKMTGTSYQRKACLPRYLCLCAGSIRQQLDAFLEGFYDIIPKRLISIFNEQELELLISGLPNIDIDDLANNTDYRAYAKTSPQVQMTQFLE
jgi:E3 ubiquitin-protein ligase HUWE1